eukprot:TRINITY_DN43721_c0_g1_i1.p1 TRINITY_DN43721_c0_g1~~TRINITY_DN43721_c0_g1_i1.p1  ORF type:complete len:558 (-),score=115.04 TRINITY_DN43721_c0_g1_i1:89-1693(-)
MAVTPSAFSGLLLTAFLAAVVPMCQGLREEKMSFADNSDTQKSAQEGGEETAGVPELMRQAAQAQYASDRLRAMKSLYDLGSMAESAAGVFTMGLIDSDAEVRRYAYAGLKGIGRDKAPSDAVGSVSRVAKNAQYSSDRARAMYALLQIGDRSKQAAEIVVLGLIDSDHDVRDYAKRIYKDILNSAPESAVRHIADTYRRSQYASTRNLCFAAFMILEQDAKPAAEEITMALSDSDDSVRTMARRMLGVVRATSSAAINFHAKSLRDQYASTRTRAINALLWLGSAAEPATADITSALMDDDAEVRRIAMKIVKYLGKVDSQRVAKIGHVMVSHQSTNTRVLAAWTLTQLGGAAKPAQNDLINTMSSANSDLARYSRAALKNIQDAERVPKITEERQIAKDPSKAEDAECFCFNKMDYDEEAEYQKVGFAQCAGMAGTEYRCDKHCNRKDKYHVTLSSESGTQTVSYCQDDGDCQCLDARESSSAWEYKLIHTFQITQDKRLQGMNLGECYSKCNKMCKNAGWTKGGCVWPKDD